MIPDPIADQQYSYTRKIDYEIPFSQDAGRVYFPVTSLVFNAPPAEDLPLDLILNGNGYNHLHYNYLQKHLARNGFMVASIEWSPGSYQGNDESNYFEAYLSMRRQMIYLLGAFEFADYITNDLILIGHSRGEKTDGIMRTGFKFFDDVGTESSYFYNNQAPNKDMIFFYGFNHRIFSEKQNWPEDPNGFASDEKDAIMGYCNAYLQYHVKDKLLYRLFFKNQQRPESMADDIEPYHQHSERVKTVLANFENNSVNVNTAGGPISVSPYNIDIIETGDAWELDEHFPHHTTVMRLIWDKAVLSSKTYVKFSYPNPKNLQNYSYLSFRVAQVYHSPFNIEDLDQDFYVRLRSGNQASYKVQLSQYGRLPYPYESIQTGEIVPKSAMNTVVMPLKAFKAVDLQQVKELYFDFSHKEHSSGEIVVDNAEFIK